LNETKAAGKQKSDTLQQVIKTTSNKLDASDFEGDDERSDESLAGVTWDERWLDAAIKADQLGIACCLARPGHKGAVAYLLKQVGNKNRFSSGLVIQALAVCKYAKLTDTFLEQVAKRTKGSKQWDY